MSEVGQPRKEHWVSRFLLSLVVSASAILTFTISFFPRWVALISLPAAVWIAVVLSRNVPESRRPLFVTGSLVGAVLLLYFVVSLAYLGFLGLCPDSICN